MHRQKQPSGQPSGTFRPGNRQGNSQQPSGAPEKRYSRRPGQPSGQPSAGKALTIASNGQAANPLGCRAVTVGPKTDPRSTGSNPLDATASPTAEGGNHMNQIVPTETFTFTPRVREAEPPPPAGRRWTFTYRLTALYVFVVVVLVVWPSVGVLLAVTWIAVLSVRWVLAHRPPEPPLEFRARSQPVARPSLSLVVLRAVYVFIDWSKK